MLLKAVFSYSSDELFKHLSLWSSFTVIGLRELFFFYPFTSSCLSCKV